MDVKLIKMLSGEDVVAELVEIKGRDSIVISNPIIMVPQQDGQVGMAPWSPFKDQNVKELEVSRNYVAYITEPISSLVENYKQIFSPIITPGGAGKIIT